MRKEKACISKWNGHSQQICGLKWNGSNDSKFLASSSNDNTVCIWDNIHLSSSSSSSTVNHAFFFLFFYVFFVLCFSQRNGRKTEPIHRLTESRGGVRALAWCPYSDYWLAAGGGTNDNTIRVYNASNGRELNSVETDGQICSLLWNPYDKEILSSKGFSSVPSQNNSFGLRLWKYPSFALTHEFGDVHDSRPLHMVNLLLFFISFFVLFEYYIGDISRRNESVHGGR